jgi:hypothetical protein
MCAEIRENETRDKRDLSEALFKFIQSGESELIYRSEEEETWGYKITPGKIDKLTFVAMDAGELKKYNEFKKSKNDSKNAK